MDETKKHTFLWLASGLFFSLLVFTVVFCGLAGKVLVVDPEGIEEAANKAMHSVRTGDWKTLELLVCGNPPLAPESGADGSAEKLIWNHYQQSLQWVCEEAYGVQGSHVTQRITVTCLDISAVTDKIAQKLLTSAETPENRDMSLLIAADAVLTSDMPTMERQLVLTFVRQNGQWQVMADQGLLSLLSGFTAH